MAKVRERVTKFAAGVSVRKRLDSLMQIKYQRRLDEEIRFLTIVQNEGLTAKAQLEFRKEQLKSEKDSSVTDFTYVRELKEDIASLKSLVTSENFRQEYFESYNSWRGGRKPLQSHIFFLRDSLEKTSDPALRSEIRTKLTTANTNMRDNDDAILDNFVVLAENDKTEKILLEALGRVKESKAKSLLGGDERRVSVLILKEQSLNRKLGESRVEAGEHELELDRLKSSHPVRTLNSYDDRVKRADSSTPIVVQGTQYDSEADYWNRKRAAYIATGQFAQDYASYYNDWLDSTIASAYELAPGVMRQIKDATDILRDRPEMRGFEIQLDSTFVNVITAQATKLNAKYLADANRTYDFQSAADNISRIGELTGIDVSADMSKLITSISNVRGVRVQALEEEARRIEFERGIPFAQAAKEAIRRSQSGELRILEISPEEVAVKTAEEIITEEPKKIEPVDLAEPAVKKPEAPVEEPVKPPPVKPKETEVEEPKPKMATLFNPKAPDPAATRQAVVVDSPEAKALFAQDFILETEPPKEEKPLETE